MANKNRVLEYKLPIRVKKDLSGGFVAECPVWKDCYAQGDTVEEAVSEVSQVAASLIELYREEGLKIPLKFHAKKRPLSREKLVDIPVLVSA